ncbi:MAG: Na(+)-translocating NADH-quinone reductase subunit A [Bacteroidales bacterium]|jgi:Na+-transporting NADH:ubiquinone oxidoreductase subunit A|nr:Na(+)-translocating NADH-quinone reductase subunit A [Bacteroidales bacterium]
MSDVITIKKGFDIKLSGKAEDKLLSCSGKNYAIKPSDFVGLNPKLLIQEGDRVKAGGKVFCSKKDENLIFSSPVSGVVKSINRGEKRFIESIVIEDDLTNEYEDFGKFSLENMQNEEVENKLLQSGLWTLIRQRPFSTIANYEKKPKCIIISGFASYPLAPDYNFTLKGRGEQLQKGVDALKKVADVPIYLCTDYEKTYCDELLLLKNVEIKRFKGEHPYGNVSVLISRIDPINKGDIVWYVDAEDLAIIGDFFITNRVDKQKVIALCGAMVEKPCYLKVKVGAQIADIVGDNIKKDKKIRYISGNILSGEKVDRDGFLGTYDNLVTLIEEGDYYEFLGWALPGNNKFSLHRTFISGFFNLLPKKYRKTYSVDTNLHGGKRAFVLTGDFERVMPLDIYPLELIKACIIGDIDKMEELGIYEVDSEDFALCEVIDVSKTNIQQIVKDALEQIRKEVEQ